MGKGQPLRLNDNSYFMIKGTKCRYSSVLKDFGAAQVIVTLCGKIDKG